MTTKIEITKYAPVIITTLCRYEHFKRCIESLSRCTGAEQTDLFIGLDYPSKMSHEMGHKLINKYVDTIIGFKKVHVIRRESNFGALKNILDLRNKIMDKYDRYISTEDDNEFSPNFLDYINKGLELYEDNPNVVAICGYSYDYLEDIKDYHHNIFPMQGFSAWGTGYWVDKSRSITEFVNSEVANKIIHSWAHVQKLHKKKQHITVHRLLFRSKEAYGDLMWRAYCALNNSYCIFPIVSKVRNWGYDGSGLNCKANNLYEGQEIDKSTHFFFDKIEIKSYKPVLRIQNKMYSGSWIVRRLCEIEYILYRLFGFNFTHLRRKFKNTKIHQYLNKTDKES